jgi:hypothetical protein
MRANFKFQQKLALNLGFEGRKGEAERERERERERVTLYDLYFRNLNARNVPINRSPPFFKRGKTAKIPKTHENIDGIHLAF